MKTAEAELFFQNFCDLVKQKHPSGADKVGVGVFGAMMQVELVNDGPVTLILDSDDAGFKKLQQQQSSEVKKGDATGGSSGDVKTSSGPSKKQLKREKKRLEKAEKVKQHKETARLALAKELETSAATPVAVPGTPTLQ